LQKLKAELGATQADAAATKDRLARAEEKSAKVEAALEREQREKQQMVDRNAVLDEEVEGAQARSEALTDEITRLKAAVKRAQDEAAIAKKERMAVEERYKNEEHTMVKRVEDAKMSALEAQGKVREDVERITKERDDARAQALEIRRIAETLKTKYKALEASVGESRAPPIKRCNGWPTSCASRRKRARGRTPTTRPRPSA
jgi:chromosome segregation ATPase